MEIFPKNVKISIFHNLSDSELVKVCQLNKEYRNICNNQLFWMNRILTKFPYLSLDILEDYKDDRNWSEYYIQDLRKITTLNANQYLLNEAEKSRLDLVIIALNKGADVNYVNYENNNALMWSIINDNDEMVEILINHGADINKVNVHGATPLILARNNKNKNIVKLLLEKGAK